ncbi:LytR family transcriptional regulator [Clostridium tarantellae]|uniref:LytR family transcriptional regulator n=2 Tax=Clostridium tarantellae TaxID=39493 RepID=A0A6I1MWB2_9CLOT|nr:LytR family transcriptional regulator [Clostridium tarantellae]
MLTIFFIFLISIAGSTWYISDLLGKIDAVSIDKNNVSANKELKNKCKNIKNIALFGVDSDKNNGRSDSIMILTLDEVHNKLKLTSIMRDSYVNIPGYEKDKINHAYAYGGPELALKTINENFNLDVTDFISVNMESIKSIIDKLSGVEIPIKEDEVEFISEIKEAGVHKLNGEQVLSYARIRHVEGGDARRTERHRIILSSLFEKLKGTNLKEYPSLINEFLPYVQTNLSSTDLINLATNFAKLIPNGLNTARFPKDEQMKQLYKNGVYYLAFDDNMKLQIQNYIFEDIS